jgi:hypothetical protein
MNPTAPMTPKPMPTAWQSFRNSFLSAIAEKKKKTMRVSIIFKPYKAPRQKKEGIKRTLLAAVNELHAILEELAGDLEDLLNLVGHCDRML